MPYTRQTNAQRGGRGGRGRGVNLRVDVVTDVVIIRMMRSLLKRRSLLKSVHLLLVPQNGLVGGILVQTIALRFMLEALLNPNFFHGSAT